MELGRNEIVDELAKRCGFYKKYVKKFLDELEKIIIENISCATIDEDAEIHLTKGLTIGAKRYPERESRDPRNQHIIITSEKSIPYAKFTYTFKQKINE